MRVLERLRHRASRAGDGNQMHMIGHETVTQQRETMELGVLVEQFEISGAVGVAGQNDLPGVAPLRNMMRDVDDNNTRQAGHLRKISDGNQFRSKWQRYLTQGMQIHAASQPTPSTSSGQSLAKSARMSHSRCK
jgi:hypothetical protein